MKAFVARLRNLPPVRLGQRVQKRYSEDGAGYLASTITYHGFLSVFPLMLLGVSAIGFVLQDDPQARNEWASRIGGALPGMGDVFTQMLQTAVERKGATGLIGLAGLVWSGTGVVRASGFALGKVFGFKLHKNFFRNNLWALGSLAGLGAIFLTSVVATSIAGGMRATGMAGVAIKIAAFTIGLLMDFVLFMAAYRLLTQRQGPRFGHLIAGSLLAAAGWSLLRLVGVWYFTRSLNGAQAVYGVFAGTVAVLVILSIGARLFMYGAELNALLIEGEVEGEMQIPKMSDARTNGHQERSAITLVRDIAADTGMLVRKEVELAKLELMEAVTARIKGAMFMVTAAVAGLLGLAFIGMTIVSILEGPLVDWTARLVVAGGFVVIAMIGIALGISKMKSTPVAPEKTVETVKEDVEWAKEQLRR